jgi:hypothetical protein
VKADRVVLVYGGQRMGAARCMRALGGLGTQVVRGEQWRPLAGVEASRCCGYIRGANTGKREAGKRIKALRAGTRGCEERHGSVEKNSRRKE